MQEFRPLRHFSSHRYFDQTRDPESSNQMMLVVTIEPQRIKLRKHGVEQTRIVSIQNVNH